MPPNLLLKDKHMSEEDKVDEISVTQNSLFDGKEQFTKGDYHNIENLDNSHTSMVPHSPIVKNTMTYLRSIPILTEEEILQKSGISFSNYL